MSGHIDAHLAELLFGDVSAEDRRELEAHAVDCARCAGELAAATETFSALASALEPEPPSPELRARILDALEPSPRHFWLDKVAQLFDLTRERARALLDRLDDPAAWQGGPVEQSWMFFVDEVGPRLEGAFCTLVKLDPGVQWPAHRHLGQELMLVLEGGYRESDGHEVHPGDVRVMAEGTAHGFTAFPHEGCLSAAIVYNGVEFLHLAEPPAESEAAAQPDPTPSPTPSPTFDDVDKR
jgi:putative transcriptional regulator